MKSISSFLKYLGLSDIERHIYISLLEDGPSSITQLAQKLQVNRVTLYFYLKHMMTKKLIVHIKEGRTRQVQAESPKIFSHIIHEKKNELEELKKEYKYVSLSLKKQKPKIPEPGLEVKLYKGIKSVRLIYQRILKSNAIRAYVSEEVESYFPEYDDLFVKTHRRRKQMKCWEVLNASASKYNYIKQMDPKRYWYKILPGKLDMIHYLIYDDTVAYINVDDEKDIKAFVIENENIYRSAKHIFDYMWHVLPER